jgi:hypothetical protein
MCILSQFLKWVFEFDFDDEAAIGSGLTFCLNPSELKIVFACI